MYVINLCNNVLPVKFAACECIHGVNACFVNTVLIPHWNIKYFQKFCDFYYNFFHNILRLFDVLINFPFTSSEKIRDYYL